MIVVGLDPSLTNTGAVKLHLENNNLSPLELVLYKNPSDKDLKVRKNEQDYLRAKILYNQMITFCQNADLVCVELPQIGGANMQARSIWTSGIALGLVAAINCKIVLLTPSDLKMVTGKKDSSKEEMCAWAYKYLPTTLWPTRKYKGENVLLENNHHIADALAAVVAGLTKEQILKNVS